VNSLHN